jgi:hypothetical protein
MVILSQTQARNGPLTTYIPRELKANHLLRHNINFAVSGAVYAVLNSSVPSRPDRDLLSCRLLFFRTYLTP